MPFGQDFTLLECRRCQFQSFFYEEINCQNVDLMAELAKTTILNAALKNWGQQKNAGQKNSAQPARPDFSAPHFSAQARSG
jgi:hypothetical protein